MIVTIAIDPRYRLFAFLSYLTNNVKEQLKLKVQKHICSEADISDDSPILPPEKPKHNPL